jgi:hypothetical protein
MCRSLSFAESIQEEEMITLKGRLEIYWKNMGYEGRKLLPVGGDADTFQVVS